MLQNIVATITLLFLDFLWLWLYMGDQYRYMIPKIQGMQMTPKLQYAVLSYVLMVIGLNLFVLPNIRKGHELTDSLMYGFTFGIIVYGIYDFTIGTVLDNWDMGLAVIDILWGGFVYFVATFIGSKM